MNSPKLTVTKYRSLQHFFTVHYSEEDDFEVFDFNNGTPIVFKSSCGRLFAVNTKVKKFKSLEEAEKIYCYGQNFFQFYPINCEEYKQINGDYFDLYYTANGEGRFREKFILIEK